MPDEMQLLLIDMSTAEICKDYLVLHRQPVYGKPVLEPTLDEKSGQKGR